MNFLQVDLIYTKIVAKTIKKYNFSCHSRNKSHAFVITVNNHYHLNTKIYKYKGEMRRVYFIFTIANFLATLDTQICLERLIVLFKYLIFHLITRSDRFN